MGKITNAIQQQDTFSLSAQKLGKIQEFLTSPACAEVWGVPWDMQPRKSALYDVTEDLQMTDASARFGDCSAVSDFQTLLKVQQRISMRLELICRRLRPQG